MAPIIAQLANVMGSPKVNAYMAQTNPRGLVQMGNLPIWQRPSVENSDQSRSTEYSTSFSDDQGREVLVPSVVNGKFLTPSGTKPEEGSPEEKAMFDAAWKHYLQTGENLGKFDNPADADAYAQTLHNRGSRPIKTPGYDHALRALIPSRGGQ